MTHGRTRIKLYNPFSGNIKKDIVSENTFQSSVIAESLQNMGYGKASPYCTADTANPPYVEILGGLFLFKNPIQNNPRFMPLGNQMIGNGAYGVINSTGTISELGSFNSGESVATSERIKMVWDFATSQANGQISCVSLTSRTGGMIGYGNPSGDFYPESNQKTDITRNLSLAGVCPQSSLETYKATVNKIVCNGKQYYFKLDGTDLEITSFKVPLKYASILDCIPDTVTIDVSEEHYSFFNTTDFIISASEGVIYLTPKDSARPSGSFFVWKYDTTDGSFEELEYNFGFTSINVSFSQELIFVPVYEGHTTKVFQLDGTLYDELETGTLSWNDSIGSVVGDFGNHSLVQHMDLQTTNVYFALYDKVAKTKYPTNMLVNAFYRTQAMRQEETSKALTLTYFMPSGDRNTYAINNPLYLATINNLQQAVTKDISLAMKVEYTLTEST